VEAAVGRWSTGIVEKQPGVKASGSEALEAENRRLKEVVLNQALLISELKKEMNLD